MENNRVLLFFRTLLCLYIAFNIQQFDTIEFLQQSDDWYDMVENTCPMEDNLVNDSEILIEVSYHEVVLPVKIPEKPEEFISKPSFIKKNIEVAFIYLEHIGPPPRA